jgi:hypothetical protein
MFGITITRLFPCVAAALLIAGLAGTADGETPQQAKARLEREKAAYEAARARERYIEQVREDNARRALLAEQLRIQQLREERARRDLSTPPPVVYVPQAAAQVTATAHIVNPTDSPLYYKLNGQRAVIQPGEDIVWTVNGTTANRPVIRVGFDNGQGQVVSHLLRDGSVNDFRWTDGQLDLLYRE